MKQELVNKEIKFMNEDIGIIKDNSIIVSSDAYSIELILDKDSLTIEEGILTYNTQENFKQLLNKDEVLTNLIQEDFEKTYEEGSWIEWIKNWLMDHDCNIRLYDNTYNFEYSGNVYEFVEFDHPEKEEGVVVMWHLGEDVRTNYSYPEVWLGDFEEVLGLESISNHEEEIAYKLGYNGDWDKLVKDVISQFDE